MDRNGQATTKKVERVGRYTVFRELAKGGMARVYVAQKDGAKEICVLKLLLVELQEHETAGKRFYREAHVASYLSHPNIARILDAGSDGDRFYIAVEFIHGKDAEAMAHKLLPQGRILPYEVSIGMMLGVLKGLSYAHQATDPDGAPLGIVHRDLSPRNLMLGYDGSVKVIDFGLVHGRVDDFRTAPGMVLGTLRYVSPEQAMTDPIDARSDIYSLSIVLHEMLSGRYVVQPGKPLDVLRAVIKESPALVHELNPNLPKKLGPVLAKGLAKDPAHRWQTADDFHDALVDAAGDLAGVAPEILGDFVRELFPEDEAMGAELIAEGERRFTDSGAHDVGSLTRAGLSETLTGGPDAHALTRAAYVRPSELTSGDLGNTTRSGLVIPTAMTQPMDLEGLTRTQFSPSDPLSLTRINPADPGAYTRTEMRHGEAEMPTMMPTIADDGTIVMAPRAGEDSTRLHPTAMHTLMPNTVLIGGPSDTGSDLRPLRRGRDPRWILVAPVLAFSALTAFFVAWNQRQPGPSVVIVSGDTPAPIVAATKGARAERSAVLEPEATPVGEPTRPSEVATAPDYRGIDEPIEPVPQLAPIAPKTKAGKSKALAEASAVKAPHTKAPPSEPAPPQSRYGAVLKLVDAGRLDDACLQLAGATSDSRMVRACERMGKGEEEARAKLLRQVIDKLNASP